MYGKDNGTGGRHPTGIGGAIQGCSAGSSSIWFGDISGEPPHGKVPGKFPAQVRQANYREADKVMEVWQMGVPTAGYKDGGRGVRVDDIIFPEDAEYSQI